MEASKFKTKLEKYYLGKKNKHQDKKLYLGIKICICLLLYAVIIAVQIQMVKSAINLVGIVAQIQVMISIYMVIAIKNKGYAIATVVNLIAIIIVIVVLLKTGNARVLPGVSVPIGTIITISIIWLYGKGLDSKLAELSRQKEEISFLYKELAISEKKRVKQNLELIEVNNKMKKREVRLNYLVYIDVLTELPNRKMMIKKMEHLIETLRDKGDSFALILIDLNNFKKINILKGYDVGDLLLKEIAFRIKKNIDKEDMLGRVGGDEFVLITQHKLNETEIYEYVDRIRILLSKEFMIDKMILNISASFGVSVFPQDAKSAIEMLKQADVAMSQAKEFGKNGICFYDKTLNAVTDKS